MSVLARFLMWLCTQFSVLYPQEFRSEFGDEMRSVFSDAVEGAMERGRSHAIALVARELCELPGSVWREHMRARKRTWTNQKAIRRPVTTRELVVTVAVFVLPVFHAIPALFSQQQSSLNLILTSLALASMAFILVVLVRAAVTGFPRWSLPFLGIAVTAIVMGEPSWRIWAKLTPAVYRILGGQPSTLPTRIAYQALMGGFSWSFVFVACVVLVLLVAALPGTRRLAQTIRQDWTLFSFMLCGGVIFVLALVFEEYQYGELWKVACWGCLALGAWFYLKATTARRGFLGLLSGVTLAYWLAAFGKWIILPLQSWGAWYGNDHWTYRRFEFGSTIAQWGWVVFFMLVPALLTLIPHSQESVPDPEEEPIPA